MVGRPAFFLPSNQVKRDYYDGMTTVELASKYGCSTKTILNCLHKSRTKMRKRGQMTRGRKPDRSHCRIELPIAHIKRLYLSGVSLNQLEQRYHASKQTIRRRLVDEDVEIRSKIGRPKAKLSMSIIQLKRAYKGGASLTDLADICNVSYPTIGRLLEANGVEIRQRGRPRTR